MRDDTVEFSVTVDALSATWAEFVLGDLTTEAVTDRVRSATAKLAVLYACKGTKISDDEVDERIASRVRRMEEALR